MELGPGESVRQRGVQLVRTEAGQKKAGRARRAGGRCGRAVGWGDWNDAERAAGVVVSQGFRRALGTAAAWGAGGACRGFRPVVR